MKTFLRNIIALLLVSGGFSPATAETMEEYRFDVPQFTTLNVQDKVNVVYHHSDAPQAYVEYKGSPAFDDAFILTSTAKTLRIQVNTEDLDQPGLPTLHVYSNSLDKVENGSDFNVSVCDPVPVKKFTAALIGNGTLTVKGIEAYKVCARITAGNGAITLQGICGEADFRMTGAGNIQASGLKSGSVKCSIFGGGAIECGPAESINLLGLGSTKVYYTGSPILKHTGGGKLIPMDSGQ